MDSSRYFILNTLFNLPGKCNAIIIIVVVPIVAVVVVINIKIFKHISNTTLESLFRFGVAVPGRTLAVYMMRGGGGGGIRQAFNYIVNRKKYISLKFCTQKNNWHHNFLPKKVQDLNTLILNYLT